MPGGLLQTSLSSGSQLPLFLIMTEWYGSLHLLPRLQYRCSSTLSLSRIARRMRRAHGCLAGAGDPACAALAVCILARAAAAAACGRGRPGQCNLHHPPQFHEPGSGLQVRTPTAPMAVLWLGKWIVNDQVQYKY